MWSLCYVVKTLAGRRFIQGTRTDIESFDSDFRLGTLATLARYLQERSTTAATLRRKGAFRKFILVSAMICIGGHAPRLLRI